jgi:hypothetical protein
MRKPKDNPDMKILKKASCKSISAKSSLLYEIALDQDNEIHVRVTKNTGGGFFSDEWIAMKDIQSVMEEHPAGTPVTSFLLQPLFHGKSVNTPAFLLAALANEKLLVPITGKKRSLEPTEDFTAMVEKMTSSKTPNKKTAGKTTKKAVTKKAAIKKKAMARKKPTKVV